MTKRLDHCKHGLLLRHVCLSWSMPRRSNNVNLYPHQNMWDYCWYLTNIITHTCAMASKYLCTFGSIQNMHRYVYSVCIYIYISCCSSAPGLSSQPHSAADSSNSRFVRLRTGRSQNRALFNSGWMKWSKAQNSSSPAHKFCSRCQRHDYLGNIHTTGLC